MSVAPEKIESFIQEFSQFDAAIISDCLVGNENAMDNGIKPIHPKQKVCGRAYTVECAPRDNLMLHLAISKAKPGDVLVASMCNHYEGGAWGEIATFAAQQRGISGLVIDGSVRDTQQIIEMGLPTFTRSISIKKTDKKNYGKINVPVLVGGVVVKPGDIVLGDADGVVIIPWERAEEILLAAKDKVAFEESIINKLKNGELTVDLFDLRKFDKE